MKEILKDANFSVELETSFEAFQQILIADKRSNTCDVQNIRLLFERVGIAVKREGKMKRRGREGD